VRTVLNVPWDIRGKIFCGQLTMIVLRDRLLTSSQHLSGYLSHGSSEIVQVLCTNKEEKPRTHPLNTLVSKPI
jgi:hypothetical protein